MADNDTDPDLPEIEDEQQILPEEETAQPKPVKTGRSGLWVAVLALLVAGGAGAASAYLWLTLQNNQQQTLSRFSGIRSDLNDTRAALDTANQRLNADLKQIGDETRGLKAAIARVSENTGASQNQWSREEIHQLLMLATDQLSLAGNVPGALAALRTADQRIVESGEAGLQPVRAQIAQDIASLEKVSQIDLAGISHRLRAVEDSIDELPLSTQSQMKPVAAETGAPAAEPTNQLQQVWQKLGSDLSGLVRIRRIDQPAVPLLPLDQQYFVRENIKTNLNAARMALLRSEAAVYRESLQQSLDWITGYFDTGSQSVKWAMDELQALAKINARPDLPDISRSLASLDSASSGVSGP